MQVTAPPSIPGPAAEVQAGLYGYFRGNWRFTRTMRGVDALAIGEAQGLATFQPGDAAHLQYEERGQLRLVAGQQLLSFSRRFGYRMEGDIVRVDFADSMQAGEEYQRYRYDPQQRSLVPVETHLCNLDRYDGRYVLIDDNQFDLHTRIEGPHKNYRLHTHYSRLRSGDTQMQPA